MLLGWGLVFSVSRRAAPAAPVARPASTPSARLSDLRGLTGLAGKGAGFTTVTLIGEGAVGERSTKSMNCTNWLHVAIAISCARLGDLSLTTMLISTVSIGALAVT